MKKYTQIIAVLIVFTLLVIAKQELSSTGLRDGEEDRRIIAPSTLPLATPTASAAVQVSKPTPKYKDGTYTGSVADAYYGNLQVQVVVSGGRLSDVKFLQYPNDNETSRSINTQAIPRLRQEALQAQSARVDTISGASDSSAAFRESLQAALKQAI